jgi:glutamate synthase (NADPH/NADH) small chain
MTKRFIGIGGKLRALECARVEWINGQPREIVGSEFQIKADLVLLAMGFLGPRRTGMIEQSGVALDARGNVKADTSGYASSEDGVFTCGDMRRGQSLVVWAIREGRQCARAIDLHLMGQSDLPA